MISEQADDTVVGDLVEATWLDAAFGLDEPPEPVELHTVGWITDTDAVRIVIAQERDEAGVYFRAYTAIPRGMLVSIHRLHRLLE